jgi:hypothetical protein
MAKIQITLEVSSRAHPDSVLEAIRVELRRRALPFVFEAINNAKFSADDGPVDHTRFHVAGDITISE